MGLRDDDQFLINRDVVSYKAPADIIGDYVVSGERPGNGGLGCSVDGDCGSGFHCVDGICVQIPITGGSCPPGHAGLQGYCYELCDASGGCPPGYDCVPADVPSVSVCVPSYGGGGGSCSTDDDCPPGFTCSGGNCLPTPCGSGCPAGTVCKDGYCYPVCDEWHACPIGFTCVDGACLPTGGSDNGTEGNGYIGNGSLTLVDNTGAEYKVFSANQHPDTKLQVDGTVTDNGNGNIELNVEGNEPATLAEAITGTETEKFLHPSIGIARVQSDDGTGLTGAAVIPSGYDASRPTNNLMNGLLRYNPDQLHAEMYLEDLGDWRSIAWVMSKEDIGDVNPAPGPISGIIYGDDITFNGDYNVEGSVLVVAKGDVTFTSGTKINGKGRGTQSVKTFTGSLPPGLVIPCGNGNNIGGGSATQGGNSYSTVCSMVGSSGCAGFVVSNLNNVGPMGFFSAESGASGATFLVRCSGTITMGNNVSIDMSGGDASEPPWPIGDPSPAGSMSGAGGGSGGVIILESDDNQNTGSSCSLSVRGGNGSDGFNYACGGGGGGGGMIITQSNLGYDMFEAGNVGSISFANSGGSGGNPAPLWSYGSLLENYQSGGGGGGGCGGQGGFGGSPGKDKLDPPVPATNGRTGTKSNAGSPLTNYL